MTRTLKGDLASGGYKFLDELRAITQISTPTTLSSSHSTVEVTNGSDITLPAAASHTGRIFRIVRTGSSAVVIRTQSLASFDPVTGVTTATPRGVFDFDNLTTLWQDTAATSAVTTAGQSIKRINNLVAAGPYFSQATTGYAPTWNTFGSYNGAVFASASTQSLICSSSTYFKFLHDGTAFTYVMRFINTTNAGMYFNSGGVQGNANVGMRVYNGSNKLNPAIYRGSAGNYTIDFLSTNTITTGTAYTWAWTYQYGRTGNDAQTRWNGSADNSQESANAPSSSNTAYAACIGASAHSTPGSYCLNAKLRRLAIYEGILDATDLANVETWAAAATTLYENISGAATVTLAAQYDKITVQSNGTTWLAI